MRRLGATLVALLFLLGARGWASAQRAPVGARIAATVSRAMPRLGVRRFQPGRSRVGLLNRGRVYVGSTRAVAARMQRADRRAYVRVAGATAGQPERGPAYLPGRAVALARNPARGFTVRSPRGMTLHGARVTRLRVFGDAGEHHAIEVNRGLVIRGGDWDQSLGVIEPMLQRPGSAYVVTTGGGVSVDEAHRVAAIGGSVHVLAPGHGGSLTQRGPTDAYGRPRADAPPTANVVRVQQGATGETPAQIAQHIDRAVRRR